LLFLIKIQKTKRIKDEEYEKLLNSHINEEIPEEIPEKDSILITLQENQARKSSLRSSTKGPMHFQEIIDRTMKKKGDVPNKPAFNVFQGADILQKKLTEAINVVKQEKKWIVM